MMNRRNRDPGLGLYVGELEAKPSNPNVSFLAIGKKSISRFHSA